MSRIVDMEWKFGVTAATSNNENIGESFIQLKLVVDKGNKELETVFMEMTLPKFYALLHDLEKAKASMELLS